MTPHLVRANGIDLAVYEAGTPGPGPSLVLVHGFPELAYSWRHQIAGLAGAGFHVLAPDMRGYGGTSAPDAIEAYDMESLCGDLVGLLDAKGIEKAVFVGHDWGGVVTWHLPLRHPERIAGLVGVCTPFAKRAPEDPIAIYARRFGPEFYIVRFQEPGYAEAILEADVDLTFRMLTQKTTPPPEGGDPRVGLSMLEALKAARRETLRESLLPEADLQVFVQAFQRTGFRGGVNWYRNFTRNWQNWPDAPDLVPHPSLMITAEWDTALPPSASAGMEKYVPNLARVMIPQAGHWVQQEAPEAVTAAIESWMRKTFPA